MEKARRSLVLSSGYWITPMEAQKLCKEVLQTTVAMDKASPTQAPI
jgi:hypothetical protein